MTPEAVRQLAGGPNLLKDVVWNQDVAQDLRPHVERIFHMWFLDRAARTIFELLRPPLAMREFIGMAWSLSAPRASTVEGVARNAGVKAGAVRKAFAGQHAFHAKPLEVVHWGIVARALKARQNRDNWTAAAIAAGTTDRSLERIAQRRLGVTPNEMIANSEPGGLAWLEERFRGWLERALGGPDEAG